MFVCSCVCFQGPYWEARLQIAMQIGFGRKIFLQICIEEVKKTHCLMCTAYDRATLAKKCNDQQDIDLKISPYACQKACKTLITLFLTLNGTMGYNRKINKH